MSKKPIEERIKETKPEILRRYAIALKKREQELEKENSRLKERVITEDLTGLKTKTHFLETVRKYLAGIQRDIISYKKENGSTHEFREDHVYAMIDLDGFKPVNDNVGHGFGDEVLKKTAKILNHVFSRETDIVARYGGDEFVLSLPKTTPEEAAKLIDKAERMAKFVTSKYIKEYGHGHTPEQIKHIRDLSASIGLTYLTQEDFDKLSYISGTDLGDYVTDLINRADENMYKEKRTKRGHR